MAQTMLLQTKCDDCGRIHQIEWEQPAMPVTPPVPNGWLNKELSNLGELSLCDICVKQLYETAGRVIAEEKKKKE